MVMPIEAIKERAIIAPEKIPNALNNPIGDNAMILNPAISEAAEPTNASAHAPPTPIKADSCVSPRCLISLYRSVT